MTWWDDFHINKHSTFIIYDYFCLKFCGVTVTVPGSLDLSVRRVMAHTRPALYRHLLWSLGTVLKDILVLIRHITTVPSCYINFIFFWPRLISVCQTGIECFGMFGMNDSDAKNFTEALMDCRSKQGNRPDIASILSAKENGKY